MIQDKLDWDRIHEAKKTLISLIWSEPDSELWYLVELINRVQELAVHTGKWRFPERAKGMRKSELPGPESPRTGELCWDSNRAVGMEWRNGEWSDIPYSIWVARHGRSF